MDILKQGLFGWVGGWDQVWEPDAPAQDGTNWPQGPRSRCDPWKQGQQWAVPGVSLVLACPQPPWEPQFWQHSSLWWQKRRVLTPWPCPGLQHRPPTHNPLSRRLGQEGPARAGMGPPFPAEGPAAPDLPFSGAKPHLPTLGPPLAPAINGEHRPLRRG